MLCSCCVVAGLLRLLGVESILLWVAVLCKKRVLVYGTSVDEVQEMVRAAVLIGSWHRRPLSFDLLRPLVTMRDEEVAELKAAAVYIAGTVDSAAVHRRDVYDILVDRQSTQSITCTLK
jgi:hypothetical protein